MNRVFKTGVKVVLGVVALMVIAAGIFLFRPAPIDPVAWTPPKRPELTGVLAPNDLLQRAELLATGQVNGPEEIAVDSQGRIYAGTIDGTVVRLLPSGGLEIFAETGGRPAGLRFAANGDLIACDTYKGLLRIDSEGKIEVLATEAEGVPFRLTDGVDVARDGTIYFTDASFKFDVAHFLHDFLENRPHGRFMSYDRASGAVTVLLRDLHFANGVALSAQEDFVLVAETSRFRVIRYWLQGPRAGTHEVFIENLPGYPDNVTSNGTGVFWLALASLRDDSNDRMLSSVFLLKQLAKLPLSMVPAPKPYGLVLALDEDGRITRSLHDPTGKHLWAVTSAREHEGHLYLGTFEGDRIGRYRL